MVPERRRAHSVKPYEITLDAVATRPAGAAAVGLTVNRDAAVLVARNDVARAGDRAAHSIAVRVLDPDAEAGIDGTTSGDGGRAVHVSADVVTLYEIPR